MVQWLRLHALNAGGTGSIPGLVIKILHATKHGQYKILKKERRNFGEVPWWPGGYDFRLSLP